MSRADPRLVRGLDRAAARATELGIAAPAPRGKLLRPRVALAFTSREPEDDRFWLGALAVQMAHEASLQHDDVLDGGTARRSTATVLARRGAGAALLAGNLHLVGAYRVARLTDSTRFLDAFLLAVEATVRGERMQRDLATEKRPWERYDEAARTKSGSLFGVAAASAVWLGNEPGDAAPERAETLAELGARLGTFQQRVDDLLDYCPAAQTDKPKLQDFANRTWTSALGRHGWEWFDQTPEAALFQFFRGADDSMAGRAAARLGEEGRALARDLRAGGAKEGLPELVEAWTARCEEAVAAGPEPRVRRARALAGLTECENPTGAVAGAGVAARALALGPRSGWRRHFARHSRGFSFAARLFPPAERRVVRDIYVFCRFIDELVDGSRAAASPAELRTRLDAWEALCRAAYDGTRTGVPLADQVMGEMARRDIPFCLAEELVEGVRMDIEPRAYASLDELRVYTHCVAAVVGEWLTRGFGERDPWMLERAHRLGHAMQLTTIIRDVGEDLALGRLYLPTDRMAAHGVTRKALERAASASAAGRESPLPPRYAALIEELMEEADSHYAAAFEAMPRLPAFYRRPVAVAAEVYRGIHDEVRGNGYDNIARRAHTWLADKLPLARRGLARLGAAPGEAHLSGLTAPVPARRSPP